VKRNSLIKIASHFLKAKLKRVEDSINMKFYHFIVLEQKTTPGTDALKKSKVQQTYSCIHLCVLTALDICSFLTTKQRVKKKSSE